MIGTTEVRQNLCDNVKPSLYEVNNLINSHNYYFIDKITEKHVVKSFAGVRPLIKSSTNANKATREYAIQCNKNLIWIYFVLF